MSVKYRHGSRELVEAIETRLLLAGQLFAGEGQAVGSKPQPVAVADFNADGKPDLASTAYDDNFASVVLGYGNGRFAGVPSVNTLSTTQRVATGDLNGDGIADLVEDGVGSDGFDILFGRGDGTFVPGGDSGTNLSAIFPGPLAIADFNADGHPDVATLGNGRTGNQANVVISLEDGDGHVIGTTTAPAGAAAYSLFTGDFNADGRVDVAAVVLSLSSTTELRVFLGKGFGGLTPTQTVRFVGGASPIVVAGDFNGDRRDDLFLFDNTTARVLLGNAKGVITAGADLPFGQYASGAVVGDFNVDGKLDVAVGMNSRVIQVLPGNGNGTFGVATVVALPVYPGLLAVNDFNGDGKLDVMTVRTSAVLVQGNGDGTFVTPTAQTPVGRSPTSIVTDDFDGNGLPDLVTASLNSGQLSVVLNQANFNPYVYVSGSIVSALGTAAGPITVGTVGPAGKLDLNDNAMVYDYRGTVPQAAAVRGLIRPPAPAAASPAPA